MLFFVNFFSRLHFYRAFLPYVYEEELSGGGETMRLNAAMTSPFELDAVAWYWPSSIDEQAARTRACVPVSSSSEKLTRSDSSISLLSLNHFTTGKKK